jgi:putative transposase
LLLEKIPQRVSGPPAVRHPPPRAFWQARFFDFNVHRPGKKLEKLNYMHANPVKRKLVQRPKRWPWSSWCHYRNDERGLVPIDNEE